MSKSYKFPCGCVFPIKGENKHGIMLDFNPKLDSIPLDCSLTWDMIGEGNTKGMFQIESQLGSKVCKDVKPRNISELADVISLMRPSCMESGMTKNYIEIRNGTKQHESKFPLIDEITKGTYHQIVYQEQNLRIAQVIAGFTLKEADVLRKAIGKKKADVMAKVKKEFIEKATELGKVTEEEAKEIFDIIEKAQRYQFNASHAVGYALDSYLSAYCKAHLPRIFLNSYLKFAKMKVKPHIEIKNLVNNARYMNIDVLLPNILLLNKRFKIYNKKIYFGLLDIKGVGESGVNQLIDVVKALDLPLDKISWFEFLVLIASKLKTTVVEALICAGALPYKVDRTKMLFEYKKYLELTKKEQAWIEENHTGYDSFISVLEDMLKLPTGRGKAIANSRRIEKVKSILNLLVKPPYSLTDSPAWISATEENLLGISMTCTNVENCDTSLANCTCKEFLQRTEISKNPILAVNVEEVREYTAKNGSEMAFLKVSDVTGVLESVVVFSDQWKKYNNVLVESNTVLLFGKRDKKQDSFLVDKVFQI